MLHDAGPFVVLAKPARLACHRSEICHDRVHLLGLAREQLGRHIHLVHRLDRATSGCLLVAFDAEWTKRLQAALTAPSATKTYWAFVRGRASWEGEVEEDTPMKSTKGVLQAAHSRIRVLGRSADPRCSLLEVRPTTGRHHQVRRHVRNLQHPVLRDAQHGDSRENVRWTREYGLARLGLHCASLELEIEGVPMRVDCPPPADLVCIWQQMPWWRDALAAQPALGTAPLDLLADEQDPQ